MTSDEVPKRQSLKKEKTVVAKEASSKAKGGYAKEFPVDKALSEFIGSNMCSRTTVGLDCDIDR